MSDEPADSPAPLSESESMPPLPTRVRLSARDRALPRQRTDVSLRLFLALILLICVAGWRGFANIGEFLSLMQKRYAPQPSPSPGVRTYLQNGRMIVEYPALPDTNKPSSLKPSPGVRP